MTKFGIPGQNISPLSYVDNRLSTVPMVTGPRSPTVNDKKYPLWTEWRVNKNASSPDEEGDFWKLIKFDSNGDAIWVQYSSSSAGPALTLSDTAGTEVSPDGTGNIQLEAGAGVAITSDAGNNKLSFSLSGGGAGIDSIAVGAGTSPVVPDGDGLVTFNVGSGIIATGGTNEVTYSLDGSVVGQTITGDSGGALSPTSGNWNILGAGEATTSGSSSTLSFLQPRVNSIIVDPTSDYGTHQTLTAALASASSGDTILLRPGTYTENVTLKAGVNICALPGSEISPTVEIVGKLSASFAGTCSISSVSLQTNSDNCLAITGSSATKIFLQDCNINASDNTAILNSSSSSDTLLSFSRCSGDLGTTGIAYLSDSSAGSTRIYDCNLVNTGGSTTQNTKSNGTLRIWNSRILSPFTISGSSLLHGIQTSIINCTAINTIPLTTSGTCIIGVHNTQLTGGSAVGGTVGSGTTWKATNSIINCSGANALTGAGTLLYYSISFTGSTTTTNVTTETAFTGI